MSSSSFFVWINFDLTEIAFAANKSVLSELIFLFCFILKWICFWLDRNFLSLSVVEEVVAEGWTYRFRFCTWTVQLLLISLAVIFPSLDVYAFKIYYCLLINVSSALPLRDVFAFNCILISLSIIVLKCVKYVMFLFVKTK